MDVVATGLSLIALGFLADHTRRIARLEAAVADESPAAADAAGRRARRGILAILALGGLVFALGVARALLGG